MSSVDGEVHRGLLPSISTGPRACQFLPVLDRHDGARRIRHLGDRDSLVRGVSAFSNSSSGNCLVIDGPTHLMTAAVTFP